MKRFLTKEAQRKIDDSLIDLLEFYSIESILKKVILSQIEKKATSKQESLL